MEKDELRNRICSLDDNALEELLSQRDAYEPEAVDIAVQEAIDRQLIQSKDELRGARFTEKRHPKSLFPYLHREKQFQKVFGSLVRSLYLVALIPLIFGALKMVEMQQQQGLGMLGLGLLWIGLSIRMQKRKDARIPLLLMVIFVTGLMQFLLSRPEHLNWQLTDFLVLGIAALLVIYGLVYLRVLLARRQGKQ